MEEKALVKDAGRSHRNEGTRTDELENLEGKNLERRLLVRDSVRGCSLYQHARRIARLAGDPAFHEVVTLVVDRFYGSILRSLICSRPLLTRKCLFNASRDYLSVPSKPAKDCSNTTQLYPSALLTGQMYCTPRSIRLGILD